MTHQQQFRSAGWAGLGIIPLALMTLPLVDLVRPFPVWTDSATQIADWFAQHRAIAVFQAFTANLAVILLIWLACGIVQVCGRENLFSSMIVPAAVLYSALIIASDSPWTVAALAGSAQHTTSPELVRFAFEICSMLVVGAYSAGAFFAFAAAMAILQSAKLPKRTAYLGFIASAALLIGAHVIPIVNHAWIAPMSWGHTAPYGLLYLFTSSISIAILRRPS